MPRSIVCGECFSGLKYFQMEIQEETPIYKDGESQYTLLRYAAMAAKWKEPPRDALDTLTLGAVRTRLYLSDFGSKNNFSGGHGVIG